MDINKVVTFSIGLMFGIGATLFAVKSDLMTTHKTIAELEKKANLVPVVTVDTLGICKVTQGGKTYMLIDVTNETKALDEVKQNIKKK